MIFDIALRILTHPVPPLFLTGFLFLYFVGIGRGMLRLFLHPIPFVEQTTLSFPLGAGVAATAVFLLGAIGQVRLWTFVILLSVTGLLSLREILSFLKELWCWLENCRRRLSPITITLLLVLFVHGLLNLLSSLAPPIEFDVLHYHLVLAKQYADSHFLSPRPDIQWSFGPQLIEMLMTLGLVLHSDILSSLLVFALSIWIVPALYQLARHRLGQEGSLLAAMVFWCMPLVVHYAPLLKTDLGMSVFILLACDQWFRLTKRQEKGRVLLLFVFLGFAVACKWTAIPSALVIGSGALWSLRRHGHERSIQSVTALSLLLAACVVLPYLVRSYLLTGNPVYPNAYRLFGGRFWNSEMDAVFRQRLTGSRSLLHFLAHPIQFSMAEIFGGHLGSPLFLTFLPILVIYRPLDPLLRRFLWGSFAIYTFSYPLFATHSRYYFPSLCLLSVPTAYAFEKIWKEGGLVRLVGTFSVGVFFLFNLFVTYTFTDERILPALGIVSRVSYLSKTLPYYPITLYANTHTDRNDRFVLQATPGYYLDRDFLNANVYAAGIMFYALKTPERLAERLQQLKIRYVILVEREGGKLDWKLFDALRRLGRLEFVTRDGGYGLYRFLSTP